MSQDNESYDLGHQFAVDSPLEGSAESVIEYGTDSDSLLGGEIAEAQGFWRTFGVPDLDDLDLEPVVTFVAE